MLIPADHVTCWKNDLQQRRKLFWTSSPVFCIHFHPVEYLPHASRNKLEQFTSYTCWDTLFACEPPCVPQPRFFSCVILSSELSILQFGKERSASEDHIHRILLLREVSSPSTNMVRQQREQLFEHGESSVASQDVATAESIPIVQTRPMTW